MSAEATLLHLYGFLVGLWSSSSGAAISKQADAIDSEEDRNAALDSVLFAHSTDDAALIKMQTLAAAEDRAAGRPQPPPLIVGNPPTQAQWDAYRAADRTWQIAQSNPPRVMPLSAWVKLSPSNQEYIKQTGEMWAYAHPIHSVPSSYSPGPGGGNYYIDGRWVPGSLLTEQQKADFHAGRAVPSPTVRGAFVILVRNGQPISFLAPATDAIPLQTWPQAYSEMGYSSGAVILIGNGEVGRKVWGV